MLRSTPFAALLVVVFALAAVSAAPALGPGLGSEACALSTTPTSAAQPTYEECQDAVDEEFDQCTDEAGFWGDIKCGALWVARTVACGLMFE